MVTFYATKNNKKTKDEIQSPVDNKKSTARGVSSSDSSISQGSNFVNNKFSRETAQDRKYIDAVNSGDMESAQKMVDEAAKAAGYSIEAYHGTNRMFNTFKLTADWGFHFGTEKAAQSRAKNRFDEERIIHAYLKLENPIYITDMKDWHPTAVADKLIRKKYLTAQEVRENFLDSNLWDIRNYLMSKGYDGAIYNNRYEDKGSTSYTVFSSEQIKSAEPVMYDDNGEVIPLSERFNEQKSDIRYSRETVDKYTEKDYNNYGWARANDVLSASENADLRSQFAALLSNQAKYPKTKSGEYMIAIGEIVQNKIAYMKGTIESPVITRVLVIDGNNETKLDEIRRETYALERRGVQRKTRGSFYTYTSASFGSAGVKSRGYVQSQRYNNEFGADRGRNSQKTARPKEYIFGEYGGVTERYSRELDYINYLNEQAEENPATVERDNLSNRALLANTLEATVQNDIEAQKLKQYKSKIERMNAEEQKLKEINAQIKELSFAKGERDTEKLKGLKDEAVKTRNRINTYDRQLLNLESTKALKAVLERERKAAYNKAKAQGKEALKAYREKALAKQKEMMSSYAESRRRASERRSESELSK